MINEYTNQMVAGKPIFTDAKAGPQKWSMFVMPDNKNILSALNPAELKLRPQWFDKIEPAVPLNLVDHILTNFAPHMQQRKYRKDAEYRLNTTRVTGAKDSEVANVKISVTKDDDGSYDCKVKISVNSVDEDLGYAKIKILITADGLASVRNKNVVMIYQQVFTDDTYTDKEWKELSNTVFRGKLVALYNRFEYTVDTGPVPASTKQMQQIIGEMMRRIAQIDHTRSYSILFTEDYIKIYQKFTNLYCPEKTNNVYLDNNKTIKAAKTFVNIRSAFQQIERVTDETSVRDIITQVNRQIDDIVAGV